MNGIIEKLQSQRAMLVDIVRQIDVAMNALVGGEPHTNGTAKPEHFSKRPVSQLPFVFVTLLGVACQVDRDNATRTIPHNSGRWHVQRWHDDSERVTCWIFAAPYKGGISCLRDAP